MGPGGVPRWSSADIRRTGLVSPPTVLAPKSITSESPKWDPVKEQFRVEVAFNLKWEVDNSEGISVSMTRATSNTTDINTTSSQGSVLVYLFGSGMDSGADIPTEVGSVTGFLVYVGKTELNGFAVAEKNKVTTFKVSCLYDH